MAILLGLLLSSLRSAELQHILARLADRQAAMLGMLCFNWADLERHHAASHGLKLLASWPIGHTTDTQQGGIAAVRAAVHYVASMLTFSH